MEILWSHVLIVKITFDIKHVFSFLRSRWSSSWLRTGCLERAIKTIGKFFGGPVEPHVLEVPDSSQGSPG